MSDRKNIWCVLGTRPEAIKLAPVIQELRRHALQCRVTVCLTGQHRELMHPLIELFDLRPDLDLKLMVAGQQPPAVLAAALEKLSILWRVRPPDWVVVQGDTITTAAAGLAAFYAGSKVAHVEAGLRTNDPKQPFPEEMNRRLVTQVTDVHFVPTGKARENLLREGISDSAIEFTGNTVVDALHWAGREPIASDGPLPGLLAELRPDRKTILLTTHRRENHGKPLEEIFSAVNDLAETHKECLQFVFPVHPNPAVQQLAYARLGSLENVFLCEPLPYLELVHLLKQSWLVLTDSGGLQEEAPSFGVPVLVLRETTERPEAVDAGVAKLVGTHSATIVSTVESLLLNDSAHAAMLQSTSPFGDGHAAGRIVKRLLQLDAVTTEEATTPTNSEPILA